MSIWQTHTRWHLCHQSMLWVHDYGFIFWIMTTIFYVLHGSYFLGILKIWPLFKNVNINEGLCDPVVRHCTQTNGVIASGSRVLLEIRWAMGADRNLCCGARARQNFGLKSHCTSILKNGSLKLFYKYIKLVYFSEHKLTIIHIVSSIYIYYLLNTELNSLWNIIYHIPFNLQFITGVFLFDEDECASGWPL